MAASCRCWKCWRCSRSTKRASCSFSPPDQKVPIFAITYALSLEKIYIYLNEQRTRHPRARSRWPVQAQRHVQGYLRRTPAPGNSHPTQLAKKLSISIRDLIVTREDHKPISVSEGNKLGDIPYFVDGAVLNVASKNPKKEPLHSGIKASDIEYLSLYEGIATSLRSAITRREANA